MGNHINARWRANKGVASEVEPSQARGEKVRKKKKQWRDATQQAVCVDQVTKVYAATVSH